jgi:hypothetical protein
MNPRHRDRVAFFRVCSGRLTKDMAGRARALGAPMRLSRVYRFFGRDRETVPEAYPATSSGSSTRARLAIGDTLYAGRRVRFPPIPQFPPSASRRCGPPTCGTRSSTRRSGSSPKRAAAGVHADARARHPIVGVVGPLQFDVMSRGRVRAQVRARSPAPRGGAVARVAARRAAGDHLDAGNHHGRRPAGPAGHPVRNGVGASLRDRAQPGRPVPGHDLNAHRPGRAADRLVPRVLTPRRCSRCLRRTPSPRARHVSPHAAKPAPPKRREVARVMPAAR